MPSKKQNGGAAPALYADNRQGHPANYSNGYGSAGARDVRRHVDEDRLRRDKEMSNGGGAAGATGAHVYSVDHLVTWSVGSEHGVLTHEDGMRQLSKMESQTGIFTMRCTLTVDSSSVLIVDRQTGDMMEQFPLECIRDPVAVRDKNGMFNNITLFTVVEDPSNKHSPSEMHIFQAVGRSAKELADDIAEAKLASQSKTSRSSKSQLTQASSQQQVPATLQRADSYDHDEIDRVRPREQIRVKKFSDNSDDSEEDVKKGVALLNRCFDDIERFVLRLKQSAKALQELSSRRRHSKSRKHGDGMLTMRSRAPAPAEFVEIFQKFKLSFILLARLKPYLHNPNSAELVHFLFTPLSLIVEASNDPRYDIHDLVRKVVTPLLTTPATELLHNCLTSKEYDFWMSLGDAWRISRNKWTQGQIQEFRPTFSDGWQPTESWIETFVGNPLANLVAKQAQDRLNKEIAEEPAQHYNGLLSNGRNGADDYNHRRQSSDQQTRPLTSPQSPDFPSPTRPSDIPLYSNNRRTSRTLDTRDGGAVNRQTPWDDYQRNYLHDLQQRSAKIYEVVQDRKGNNSKELTIRKGEIVEVLDDDRNWWKCSNINGDQGFVPYTLLKRYENVEALSSPDDYSPPSHGLSSRTAPPPVLPQPTTNIPAPPPPPPTLPPPSQLDTVSSNNNWRLNKKPQPSQAEKRRMLEEQAATRRSDDFSHELKQRLSKINLNESGQGRRLSSSLSAQVFIDNYSSADEVADWLSRKGFQQRTQQVLAGYSGSEIFHLSSEALLAEFGQQEGARLVSQLRLMKTTAGYTQSGSSQLRKILERRKQRAEDNAQDANDRRSPNSDVVFDLEDSDEFASASLVRSGGAEMSRRY